MVSRDVVGWAIGALGCIIGLIAIVIMVRGCNPPRKTFPVRVCTTEASPCPGAVIEGPKRNQIATVSTGIAQVPMAWQGSQVTVVWREGLEAGPVTLLGPLTSEIQQIVVVKRQ